MCEQCEGLDERFRIESAKEFRSRAAELQAMVDRQSLQVTESFGSTLAGIIGTPHWESDIIEINFICTRCSTHFKLSGDMYHGSVWWHGKQD